MSDRWRVTHLIGDEPDEGGAMEDLAEIVDGDYPTRKAACEAAEEASRLSGIDHYVLDPEGEPILLYVAWCGLWEDLYY